MDNTDKFYSICEKFDDNLQSVAVAIRLAGAVQKPAYIKTDIEQLWISKYSEQINHLYSITQNKEAIIILISYIKNIRQLSRKYNFNPSHEVKIGSIQDGFVYPNEKNIKREKESILKQQNFTF